MAFETRAQLESEIEARSAHVRDLQEQLKSQCGGVTLDDVKRELQSVLELKKQLLGWAETPADLQDERASDENDGAAVNAASPKKPSKKKKRKSQSPKKDAHVYSAESLAAAVAEGAERAEIWAAVADTKLDEIEDQVVRLERTKRATEYLESHKSAAVETVTVKVQASNKETKKTKSSKKNEVAAKEATVITTITTETAMDTSATATAADSIATEQAVAAAVTALEDALAQEKASTAELLAANEKLRLSDVDLRKAHNELEKSLAELQVKNNELLSMLDSSTASDGKLRDEVSKLQRTIQEFEEEKDAKETHLGKLWKSIDEFQVRKCLGDLLFRAVAY